jgi:hypothetical protein
VTLLVRRAPPVRATQPQLQLASRLTSRATWKMLLSDLCNRLPKRAPMDRSDPERTANRADRATSRPKPRDCRSAEPRFDGGPASGGRAIDVAPPTSIVSTTTHLTRRRAEHRTRRGRLTAVLSTARQAGDRSLAFPVAPRPRLETQTGSRSQRRFHRPLVKRSDFHGSKRLPPTSAPRSCFCSIRARGTRHHAHGFATVSTASDASSPPVALALEG